MELIDHSTRITSKEEKERIVFSLKKRISDFENGTQCRFAYTLIFNPEAFELKDSIQLKDGIYWNVNALDSSDVSTLGGLRPKLMLFRYNREGINNLLCIIRRIDKSNKEEKQSCVNICDNTEASHLTIKFFENSIYRTLSAMRPNYNRGALICLVGDSDSESESFVDVLSEKLSKPSLTIKVNDVLKENGLLLKTFSSERNRIINLSHFDFLFSDLTCSPKIPNRELSMLRLDIEEYVKTEKFYKSGNIIILNVTSPLILNRDLSAHVFHVENIRKRSRDEIRIFINSVFPQYHNGDSILPLLTQLPNKAILDIVKRCYESLRIDSKLCIDTFLKLSSEKYLETQTEFQKVEGADFKITSPNVELDRVVLSKDNMEKLQMALASIINQDLVYNIWGFSEIDSNIRTIINFYGPPGTGKTLCANAIASELTKQTGHEYLLLSLNYSEIESMYVGEAPKKLERVFNFAKDKKIVLFFDEADSFLGKRIQNVSQGSEQAINSLRSTMLIQLEKYKGVVIFATNLTTNYDSAFKTRFLAEIEFPLPDKDTCKKIFAKNLPSKLNSYLINGGFNDTENESIATNLVGLSGRDIKTIIWRVLLRAAQRDGSQHHFKSSDFIEEIKIYKKEKKSVNSQIDLSKVTTEVTPASQVLAKRLGLGNKESEK